MRVWSGCAALCLLLALSASTRADTTDRSARYRWHIPTRGERTGDRAAVGPVHEEWNLLGRGVDAGKQQLAKVGLRFDTDLDFYGQWADRVVSGQSGVGTFSWQLIGDWQFFDLGKTDGLGWLGRGYVGFTAFGAEGFDYDPAQQTLTGNVGAIDALNGTVVGYGAVLDELFWKQVTLDGRLVVLGGKVDLLYHFDQNLVASNAYTQYFAGSLQTNPSIPGPAFGGFGAIAQANVTDDVYVMFGFADSSMDQAVMPWVTLQNDSWYELLEIGVGVTIPGLRDGNYRLTPWHNRIFGQSGFGVAMNFDQELGRKDVVAFFRFGVGDEDVTPVKMFASGGVAVTAPFGRDVDLASIGVAWSDPSPGHGTRAETLLEVMYQFGIVKAMWIAPDLELVFDPADNPVDDFVVVGGLRMLMQF